MSSETDGLLGQPKLTTQTSLVQEYSSIAVAVIENEDHEAVVVHDYSGAVLLDCALERHDSLVDSIGTALEEQDLEGFPHDGDEKEGQATVASTIASMSKNLIGCGALSLANGIAICANTRNAIWAGNFWIVLLGAIFGFMCYLIGEVCQMTGRTTYRGIWQETVGHKGAGLVSVANALKAAIADLAYASILSDTTKSLFASMGLHVPRVTCLLLVTVSAVLPLCMMKNLHVLAPFSVLGTVGIGLTALAMAIRYVDGSYQPGGVYFSDIKPVFQPSFGHESAVWSTQILLFVCMVYEAYVMHYNSARFYNEIKGKSLPRFKVAVSASFSLAALAYTAIASLGYLTFGGNSAGFILNNYSPYDPLASVSRILVGLSTLMAYPIVFFGVRDGVLDIFEVPLSDQTPEKLNALTVSLLAGLTVLAIFVTDLGLINAVGGGLVTAPIVFVFPAIMYRQAIKLYGGEWGEMTKANLFSGLVVVSVVLGVIGAWTAVSSGSS